MSLTFVFNNIITQILGNSKIIPDSYCIIWRCKAFAIGRVPKKREYYNVYINTVS